MTIELTQRQVQLPRGRPRLAVRGPAQPIVGTATPFLLVHGLASNARLWDGLQRYLHAAGHPALAVDQRGHGLSEEPAGGYDTDTCADDLAALALELGWTGAARPVVVGQSWGGNVVLSLAARHPGAVAAVACVDGGWIRLKDRFTTFEDCWQVLEPPRFDGLRYADLVARIRAMTAGWPREGAEGTLANLVELPDGSVRARLSREHHREIVRSLYEGDPHAWYPAVDVPVLLVPAVGERPVPGEDERAATTRAAVRAALTELPAGHVSWYAGAHHDLHAEQPERLARDLLAFTKEEDR